jgi:predicted nucleic acid-binding protein
MNPAVVDSSVAYKWLHPEGEGHVEEAHALLMRHRNGTVLLAAPANVYVELANALRHSKLDPAEVIAIINAFGSLGLELIEGTPERLARATRLSYRYGISVYDALFLQAATELDCPLVTADRRAFADLDCGVEIRLI